MERRTATIVGALFLLAMVTSLVGGVLIESILETPDYLGEAYANATLLAFGVVLELVNAAAVVGIAVMMFSIFARFSEVLARAYVAYRVIEAAVIAVAVISPLALITISQDYGASGSPDASGIEALGVALVELRGRTAGLLIPFFFSVGAVIFYWLLYRSRIVPRFISVWGLISVALILAFNLADTFGISVDFALVLALPMILNEVFLGIWLIAKGFSPAVSAPAVTGSPGAVGRQP